jgi:hypothetical protein
VLKRFFKIFKQEAFTKRKPPLLSVDNLEAFLLKNLSSMRSDLLHPYVGLKVKAFLSTMNFIEDNMSNAVVCNNRNEVFNYALKNLSIKGMIAEFGVKSAQTINQLSLKPKLQQEIIYGFDSFVGLPEDWSGTKTLQGQLSNLGKLPKINKNVRLVTGWFKDSLPIFLQDHKDNFALIHIDCDIYQSTKDIFTHLETRLVKGTIIIFDEFFNYPNWKQHEYKAFQEFLTKSAKKFRYLCYAHTQVAIEIL